MSDGEMKYFRSYLGEWLAIDGTLNGVWYSEDGVSFYKLYVTGNGSRKYTVRNHQLGWKGEVFVDGDNLLLTRLGDTCNKPIFRPITKLTSGSVFYDLPDVYDVQALYQLNRDVYVVWYMNRYYTDYKKSKVFVGPLNAMRQTIVTDVQNFVLTTLEGDLDLSKVTWEGYRLDKLDDDLFDFVEEDNLLKVSLKKEGKR